MASSKGEEPPGASRSTRGDWRDLGGAGLLAAAWVVLPLIFLGLLVANLGAVSDWLAADPLRGAIGYLALFTFGAGLGLLPTHVQAFLGGFVFGLAPGGAAAVAGATLAAVLGWAVARLVGSAGVERFLARDAAADAVRAALVGRGRWRALAVVLLVRMSPSSPFALTNLALGTTGTPLLAYAAGTAAGMAPRTLLVASMGAAARATGAEGARELARGPGLAVMVVGALLLLAAFAILAKMSQSALDRLHTGSLTANQLTADVPSGEAPSQETAASTKPAGKEDRD